MDLIAAAFGAYVAKDGINKLLGPTFEYLGGGLKNYTEKACRNLGQIFKSACTRLGEDINQPGTISPRVLKSVMNEGAFCEDSLAAEYWAGVLASSRTTDGQDDRGLRMCRLLENMSTWQIKTHYLIYSTIRQKCRHNGTSPPFVPSVRNDGYRARLMTFIPADSYSRSLLLYHEEDDDIFFIMEHSLVGLSADKLIENDWFSGPKLGIQHIYPSAKKSGFIITPSMMGVELYLWACGAMGKDLDDYLQRDFVDIPENNALSRIDGAILINHLGTLAEKQKKWREQLSREVGDSLSMDRGGRKP